MIQDFNNFYELNLKVKEFEKKLEKLNSNERLVNQLIRKEGFLIIKTKDYSKELDSDLTQVLIEHLKSKIELNRKNLIAENNLLAFR